jgi:transcriptional regulator with XRE-family HTH domain
VRQLRHERGLTLEAASGKASIDITHWQKVEAGSVNVSMVTLVRLADGLDVNLVDLFAAGPPGKRAAR